MLRTIDAKSWLRKRHSFLLVVLFLQELSEVTVAMLTRCVVQNRLLLSLAMGMPGV